MKHRTFPSLAVALALIAVLVVPLLSAPASAQEEGMTAEQLVEKNLEAKGGREKLESVEAARLQGTMNVQGIEAPFTLEWKAPGKTRMELTIQGMTMIQAYDGETGWMIMPFTGKTTPEKMSAEDSETFKDQAEFHGPLLDYEEKGYTVAYAGEEEVEGTPTHKLVVTKPSGEEVTLFLDQEYFLEIKQASKRTVRDQEVEVAMAIGDYKEVEGLLMAHSIDAVGAAGPGAGFNMTIESVDLNPEISEERFVMPEVPAAEEGEPEGEGR